MKRKNYLLRLTKNLGLALALLNLPGCGTFEHLIKVPIQSELTTIKNYDTELHQRSIHIFNPIPLDRRVAELRLEPRVDHLFFLIDQSSALSDEYRGVESRLYAREIVRRFVRTMPDQTYSGTLLIYNQGPISSEFNSEIRLTNYTVDDIDRALNTTDLINRIATTSLAAALGQLSELISRTEGSSAVILVTSWSQIDIAVEQVVMRMRQRSSFVASIDVVGTDLESTPWQGGHSGVCFYALGVGNHLSRTRLEKVDSCGYSVAANKVAQPRDMAHFVQTVLYKGPADSDGDGIFDYQDRCPDTSAGRTVDYSGCLRFAVN